MGPTIIYSNQYYNWGNINGGIGNNQPNMNQVNGYRLLRLGNTDSYLPDGHRRTKYSFSVSTALSTSEWTVWISKSGIPKRSKSIPRQLSRSIPGPSMDAFTSRRSSTTSNFKSNQSFGSAFICVHKNKQRWHHSNY